jgi:hypothetical protein
MMNRIINTETADTRWIWLYKLGALAALMAGALVLMPIIELVITRFQPGTVNRWSSLLQNNWLVVIFKLHAGLEGVQPSLLYILNPLDIALMALIGTMYLGLYAALRRTSKIWSIVALAQPFLGIVIFMATRSAGRSGVMGAGLVISIVMLRSRIFNKVTAYMGILSSSLLFVGDISVGISQSYIFAILTAIGYVLLTAWFFLIAQRLFQLGGDIS